MRKIVFRCDGTEDTGTGHVSRMTALAEAFDDSGCRCSFLGKFDGPMQDRLTAAGMQWELLEAESWTPADATEVTNLSKRIGASGIVVDSYEVGADFVEQVERNGAPLLLIDDFASLPRYQCSAVLNFTSRAPDYFYPSGPRYFFGPRWFLARRTLRHLRARGHEPGREVRHVLVTSGGHDAYDITLPMIESLSDCSRDIAVHVVVGPAYAMREQLQTLLSDFNGETSILTRLPDLSEELGWADVCFSGAGLTKYESAYVGMPAGVLSQNEGQARDTVRFQELGLTVDLGLASEIDRARLTSQVRRLMTDYSLRKSLHRNGVEIFPEDPTRDLAAALLDDVFRS